MEGLGRFIYFAGMLMMFGNLSVHLFLSVNLVGLYTMVVSVGVMILGNRLIDDAKKG